MKEAPDENHNDIRPTRRGFFFWLGRAFLYLLLFFFAILIAIQLPPVQTWGARQISKSISKTLNTRVSIGGFNLHPLSDLSLTDVFIGSPEYSGDTLIRAERLSVDFQRLWDLFYNKFNINEVIINDGFMNIEKKSGDTLTNLDMALLRLLPEKKDTSKGDFVLDLEKISATQLHVRINDNTKGSLINMMFERADISLDTFDMAGQYFYAEYMDFDNPLIYITQKITEPVTPSSNKKKNDSWSFDIGSLRWSDGKLVINNETVPHDTSQLYGIDYAHMTLVDIDIAVDSLTVRDWDIRSKNMDIHILHQNGFELKTLSADNVLLTSEGINLVNLELQTAESHIQNSVEMAFSGYSDFKSFADSVVFSMPDANITLHINDILSVLPSMGKVSFFADNKDKAINVTGNINGHVNRLRVLDMKASMGGITLEGDFRSRDLTVAGSQLLSLDMDRASFSADALKDLFPRMKIPPQLRKLGRVNFNGKFDGYPDDFVAFGNFTTALGNLTMDMNLNFTRGINHAKYSGTISMDNFDLGRFIDFPDIGRVSMTGRVIEGSGLDIDHLEADITAVMSYAVYRGYTYRNARLDGIISNRMFTGTMDINDPNVDMHFEGVVDFTGSLPKLDFVSRIDSIRLLPLGFGSDPIDISGIFDVDFTAGSIDKFKGSIQGEKITVRIKGVDYYLDSLYVDAVIDSVTGDRFYNFESDLASGFISGVFNPLLISGQVHQYLHEQYPSLIEAPVKSVDSQPPPRVAWDIKIHESGPWLDIVGLPGFELKNTYTHGNLDLAKEQISGFIDLPEIHYGGFNIYATTINFDEVSGNVDSDIEVIAADLNESLFFEDVLVSATGTDDSVKFRIQTDHIAEIIDELDVEILADPEGGRWTFSINPISLEMFGESWMIPAGNLVEFRRNYFNLDNFELVSGDRRIVVNDIDNKGIEAFITGFDVSYLNTLWITDKFEFSGTYTLDLEVDNIYDIQQLSTVLHVPELKINNQPYGEWIFNAGMNDPKDSVQLDLVMTNNETQLTAKGAYLPPIKSIPKDEQNYLRLAVEAEEFPLDFLEFLMGGNIRDTEGQVDLVMTLKGKANRLEPRGQGKVYNGSTTIDYLGTAYSFHDQSFTITETMIDLSGTRLYDVRGNSATLQGGLTHRYLKNLGLDARITSDNILALDVSSEENSTFFGTGIGSVDATFSGTIVNPEMNMTVTTAEETHIYIPLSGGAAGTEKDFVIFLENGQLPVSKLAPFDLGGISLNMNLNITEDAIVEIIFDDNTGEVLRAIGEGALQINMTRTGNLSMYGNYSIIEGDYLFTNFKIVRKPFEILPGGEIQWTGDPYDANINIEAKYKGLTAPVFPLIAEFTPAGDALSAARERTEIDLTMTLSGSLLQPNIAFDIEFPNLTGAVKGYADTKLNDMRANPNAMMQQVMGLLVTRSFLPPSSGFVILEEGLKSTLSETISSTLSSYLSGLLGDIVPEGQFLTGIDLQVGLDIPLTTTDIVGSDGTLGDPALRQYTINLPLEFFNDRLSFSVGGNYVTGATYSDRPYFAPDITLEYEITDDRRLKIRMYNRTSKSFEGDKNKLGLGLAYRREYDSFPDIFRSLFGRKKEKKKEEVTPQELEGG